MAEIKEIKCIARLVSLVQKLQPYFGLSVFIDIHPLQFIKTAFIFEYESYMANSM